jgi:hypothetical protein
MYRGMWDDFLLYFCPLMLYSSGNVQVKLFVISSYLLSRRTGEMKLKNASKVQVNIIYDKSPGVPNQSSITITSPIGCDKR